MNLSRFETSYVMRTSSKAEDYIVVVNGNDRLMPVPIQVFNYRLFLNDDMLPMSETILASLEGPSYRMETTMEAFMSKEITAEGIHFNYIEMKEEVYMRLRGMEHMTIGTKKVVVMAQMPSTSEREMHKDQIWMNKKTKWDQDRLDWAVEVRAKIVELRVAEKNWRYKKENAVKEEDMVSELSSVTGSVNVTVDEVSHHLKIRHDIFALWVMEVLKIKNSRTTDRAFRAVDHNKVLETEEANKTPDFIVEDADTINVYEMFVTDHSGAGSKRVDLKMDKYSNIVAKLSKNGKPTKLHVVGLSVEDGSITATPEVNVLLGAVSKKGLDKMLEICRIALALPAFYTMKKFMEASDERTSSSNTEIFALRKELSRIIISKMAMRKTMGLEKSMMENPSRMNEQGRKVGYRMDNYTMSDMTYIEEITSKDKTTFRDMQRMITERARKGIVSKEVRDMVVNEDTEMAVRATATAMLMKKEAIAEISTRKTPRLFKIPVIPDESKSTTFKNLHASWRIEHTLEIDGSLLFSGVTNRFEPGIDSTELGVNRVETMRTMESVFEVLDPKKEGMDSSILRSILRNLGTMAREIMLASDRRFAISNKSFNLFKKFDKFSLIVAASGKVKRDSQLTVKILTSGYDPLRFNSFSIPMTENVEHGSKFNESEWFTLQLADLEHYVKIYHTSLVVVEDMRCKHEEANTKTSQDMMSKSELIPIIIMMEHKRGTSTVTQFSRYVMHAFTSIMASREGLISDIFDLPVRSTLHSYFLIKLVDWINEFTLDVVKLKETDFLMPSMWVTEMEIPFSVMMCEIYYCNLFNPSHGMVSHREKPTVDKMIKMENEFVKRETEGNIHTEFVATYGNPKYCSFSPAAIREASDLYLKNGASSDIIQLAVETAMSDTLAKVLKMTRSVTGIPDRISNLIKKVPKRVEKMTVFEAVFKEFDSLKESQIMEMITTFDSFVAGFSMFTKPQIGSIREILIQAIKTRVFTSMFNSFFEVLCKYHPKEMVTKEEKKREVQSKTSMNYQDRVEADLSRLDRASAFVVINSDASKWAPNQVMTWYSVFLSRIKDKIPGPMYEMFIDTLAAFSNKAIYLPTSLKEKMDTWSMDDIAGDKILSKISDIITPTGMMIFRSGMGQGNFQHPSSFMHCIIDDASDVLVDSAMRAIGVTVETTTLISSDDSTKMRLFTVDVTQNTEEVLKSALLTSYDIFINFRSSSLIITNMKKTAMHSFLSEFNSVFSIYKDIMVPSIKSAYNACNVVDYTSPYKAVTETISNCARLLYDNCYIRVITLALEQCRDMTMTAYNLHGSTTKDLMWILKCTEEELPADLGYVPTMYPVETILYGVQIHMFNHNSDTLTKFYENLYSESVLSVSEMEDNQADDFTLKAEIICMKRVDKQLMMLKARTLGTESKREKISRRIENSRLNDNSNRIESLTFRTYLEQYLMSTTSNYGFSHSMKMNSMVRAMQLVKSCCFKSELNSIAPMNKKERERSEASVKEGRHTIVKAVSRILNVEVVRPYSGFYSYFRVLLEEARTAKATMDSGKLVSKSIKRHPKFRSIATYKVDEMENYSESSLIEMIMNRTKATRRRTMITVKKIAKMMGLDESGLFTNPMATIVSSFKSNPIMTFKKGIRLYLKHYGASRSIFVLDNPTTGTRYKDVMNIHLFRTRPDTVYQLSGESTTDYMKSAMNRMSFGTKEDVKDMPYMRMEGGDSRATSAIKLYAAFMRKKEFDMTIFMRNPVYSDSKKSGLRKQTWLTGATISEMRTEDSGIVSVELYHDPSAGISLNRTDIMREVSTLEPGTIIRYSDYDRTSVEVTAEDFMTIMTKKMLGIRPLPMLEVSFKRTPVDWSIIVHSENMFSGSFYRERLSYYRDFGFLSDRIKNFEEATRMDSTLSTINDYIISVDLDQTRFERITLSEADDQGSTSDSDVDEDSESYQDLVNNFFAIMSSSDNIMMHVESFQEVIGIDPVDFNVESAEIPMQVIDAMSTLAKTTTTRYDDAESFIPMMDPTIIMPQMSMAIMAAFDREVSVHHNRGIPMDSRSMAIAVSSTVWSMGLTRQRMTDYVISACTARVLSAERSTSILNVKKFRIVTDYRERVGLILLSKRTDDMANALAAMKLLANV